MDMQVAEAVQKVDKSKADENVRVIKAISVGEAIQQGDLYIHRVKADHPVGKLVSKGDTQVAEGTTLGARHVASGDIAVYEVSECPDFLKVPDRLDWTEMAGPVVDAKKTWNLKHPEHADFSLPAGRYQVTYQYDPRTMKRTID